MSRRENKVGAAFWPGPDALRWWTVTNEVGIREVIRVDTMIPETPGEPPLRFLLYLVMRPGVFAHPPLAAAVLRTTGGFEALEMRGVEIIACIDPDVGFTTRGLKYELLFCPEAAAAAARGDGGSVVVPWTYEESDA